MPQDFADKDYLELIVESVSRFTDLEFITMEFRITQTGVIVLEVGTHRTPDFTFFEYIGALEKLKKQDGKPHIS